MQTYAPKPQDVERRWYLLDADGAVLGRLASEAAKLLRGKHKPIFAPHADTGDHVIVVNARGVRLTGGKEEKKVSFRHSGYPGGLRETVYSRLLERRPAFVVEKAIRGMLPKNRLGRAMIRKLQVYEGPEHPHRAQKPVALKLGEVPRWEGLPAPKPAPAPRKAREGRPPAEAPERPRTTKKTSAKKSTAKTTRKSTAKGTAKTSAKTTSTSRTSRGAKKTTAKSSSRTRSRRTSKEES
jgi:large subunit ribosomal protein L13